MSLGPFELELRLHMALVREEMMLIHEAQLVRMYGVPGAPTVRLVGLGGLIRDGKL